MQNERRKKTLTLGRKSKCMYGAGRMFTDFKMNMKLGELYIAAVSCKLVTHYFTLLL